jgi:hypothetical protein
METYRPAPFLVAFLVASSGAVHVQAQDECSRPGDCTIALTAVAELSDAAAPGEIRTDTRRYVGRDSRGRFFTAGNTGPLVFDGPGAPARVLGRRGQGPGEFISPASPLIGPRDSIYVYDHRQRRMSVYSPSLEPAREFHVAHAPDLVLSDGSFLVARQIPADPDRVGFPAHRVSAEGEFLESFGTEHPAFRPDLEIALSKVATRAADGNVWLVPMRASRLEKWNPISGERIQSLEIDFEWFVESFGAFQEESKRPLATHLAIWEDPAGRVWFLTRVPDDDETRIEDPHYESTPDTRAALFDWVLGVVDPATGGVLANRRFERPTFMNPQSGILTSFSRILLDETVITAWRASLQPAGR